VDALRLDKWLWSTRIYKTRSQATAACRSGHVKIDGENAKPAHAVQLNEIITAKTGEITRTLRVIGLIERRVGAALAKQFVEDLTAPEEYTKKREPNFQPLFFRPKGEGRPTKRDRRKLESLNQTWTAPD
jgi:ribosome-associated heat shock protein Hsp15